jgi:hypothetical protein
MKSRLAFLLSLSILLLVSRPGNSHAQKHLRNAESALHPSVSIIQPVSGTVLIGGSVTVIEFDSWQATDTVTYSLDGGVRWNQLAIIPSAGHPSTYNWTVPDTNSNTVYLKVLEGDASEQIGPFTIKPAGSAVSDAALPTQYTLGQNYPNPSTGFSSITYAVPTQASITLSVSDLLGREVRRVESKTLSSGTYQSKIDMSGLPNGTYLYTLHANDRILQGKMILAK